MEKKRKEKKKWANEIEMSEWKRQEGMKMKREIAKPVEYTFPLGHLSFRSIPNTQQALDRWAQHSESGASERSRDMIEHEQFRKIISSGSAFFHWVDRMHPKTLNRSKKLKRNQKRLTPSCAKTLGGVGSPFCLARFLLLSNRRAAADRATVDGSSFPSRETYHTTSVEDQSAGCRHRLDYFFKKK